MNLHKEPKTIADVEHNRDIVFCQLQQIKADTMWVNCATCDLVQPLYRLYRCYYCGIWVCENCAPIHFGRKRSLMFRLGIIKRVMGKMTLLFKGKV